MNTNAVSKATTEAVSKEIMEAVNRVLAKHNLKTTKVTSKYGDMYALNIQATAVMLNEDGINMASPDVLDYQRNGYIGHVVNPDSTMNFPTLTAPIGTRIQYQGKVYAFAGVRSRGKNKLVMQCLSDGKEYAFPDQFIIKLNEVALATK